MMDTVHCYYIEFNKIEMAGLFFFLLKGHQLNYTINDGIFSLNKIYHQ